MIMLEAFERSPRLAELKVSYRRPKLRKTAADGTDRALQSPMSAVAYLRAIWDMDTIDLYEQFLVVCLNNGNRPTGWVRISSGGFGFAPVEPKLVFAVALQTASSAIIIAHNHPSRDRQPSTADKETTKYLVEAGNLLSIRVLDHIILTRGDAFSFLENGLMPTCGQEQPLIMRKTPTRRGENTE